MTALQPTNASTTEIASSILVLRGQKVLLDASLAAIYGVTTKALNQAVKRNSGRFPPDFVYQLTSAEAASFNRSQTVTARGKHRNVRHRPLVFTEHGAIMAATILKSPRAVDMSVFVVRAFVQLRELAASNSDLDRRLRILEARVTRRLGRHDREITAIIKLVRQMMATPRRPRSRPIGFTANVLDE